MLEPGVIIAGDFRIDGILGEGGMGVVYEARQLSLDRTVALKLIGTAYSENIAFRERFRREGRIQANIEHRHIIDVYAAGESEYGLYLAMRLVRGVSLGDLIGKSELTVERTVRVLTEIGSALDAAHEVGLIHRDIKPHNILIDLRREHSYLADFGVTKARDTTGLTQAGQQVGTYAYMAPEQFRGKDASEKSDIYAFGAVLYESLVGSVPYPMPTIASIIHAHLSEPVPAITEHRPELPPLLDRVVRKAMAKDPEERYEKASEMMREVARALESSPAPEVTTLSLGSETTISPSQPATSIPTVSETSLSEPQAPAPPTRAPEPTIASEEDEEPVAPRFEVPAPTPATAVSATTPVVAEGATDVVTSTPPPDATELAPPGALKGFVARASQDASGETAAAPPAPTRTKETRTSARTGPRRRVPIPLMAVGAIGILAVIGFLVGRTSAPENRRTVTDATQTAMTSGDVSVVAPVTWRKASDPADIPGLKLASPLALAPKGDKGSGGLLAGTTAQSWPTFLPPAFRRLIGQAAIRRRSVVRLGDLSAYRYAGLKPRGFDGSVTVYAVPQPKSQTLVACFGTGSAGPPRDCDSIAASLQVADAAEYPLTPPAAYARAVRRAISRLDSARARGLRGLQQASTQPQQAAAASSVAKAYALLASRLNAAEPTAYVRPAHAALVRAARGVQPAYAALGRAARSGSSGSYEAARRLIRTREAQLRRAIADLKQVGFRP